MTSVDALAERVASRSLRGRLAAVDLSGDESWELVNRLDIVLDLVLGDARGCADARLVLGSACTTATKAVEQFVTALQLPYDAARGWGDFLEHLGERPASARSYVVVADACDLLKHEDYDRWRELVERLCSGPSCMGGGWSTLVLADHELMWEDWVFRSAVDAAPPRGLGLLTIGGVRQG
ncbi:hypothetical protein ACQPZP_00490 [Spirillospora sp. CA-142024]|uniref:hypothetical protein n=1 Tax=Spirillospora sp. CA-142024 TaxID=3240036 RepID=UPI003D91443A